MRVIGRIHYVDIQNKIIGIIRNKRVLYFHITNSQMTLYKRYLYENNYIDLESDDKATLRSDRYTYNIKFVYSLFSTNKRNRVTYFDKKRINTGLKKLINSLGNILILDLEMTMPSYNYKGKGFKPEIIQAGYILYDEKGTKVSSYSEYIKPKIAKNISNRAEEFLGISNEDFQSKAVPYANFYKNFSSLMAKYNPSVLVYGRNDILVLNSSYNINGLPSLQNKTRYINLCSLIKNFYNLKFDPGLFKLYDIYNGSKTHQEHNAFNDSEITFKVFEFFRNDVNQITDKAGDIKRELE